MMLLGRQLALKMCQRHMFSEDSSIRLSVSGAFWWFLAMSLYKVRHRQTSWSARLLTQRNVSQLLIQLAANCSRKEDTCVSECLLTPGTLRLQHCRTVRRLGWIRPAAIVFLYALVYTQLHVVKCTLHTRVLTGSSTVGLRTLYVVHCSNYVL